MPPSASASLVANVISLCSGIRRFKLVDFDNLLVRYELHKTAVESMCDLGVE